MELLVTVLKLVFFFFNGLNKTTTKREKDTHRQTHIQWHKRNDVWFTS